MSNDNENKRDEGYQGDQQHSPVTQPSYAPAQGPGVPPISSAPIQGQGASAFVQPAQTIPDGDPRFAQRDAGTPYVVGLGHVSTNPTQLRNDQEKAAKEKADRDEGKDEEPAENSDTDEEQNRNL
jgi:hypothetical protein